MVPSRPTSILLILALAACAWLPCVEAASASLFGRLLYSSARSLLQEEGTEQDTTLNELLSDITFKLPEASFTVPFWPNDVQVC